MIADEGCAERGCPAHDSRDGPGVQMVTVAERDKYYEMGWNSALELAAGRLATEFRRAFGEDTLTSIAVYIKGMKK